MRSERHLSRGRAAAVSPLVTFQPMDILRHVVVFDATDLDAESNFWAGMFGGHVTAMTRFTASSMPQASGVSASSQRRTTFHRSGRTGLHSKCISTFTFKTRVPLIAWRSGWAHGCYRTAI